MLINIIIIIVLFIVFCIIALLVFNNDVQKKMANRQKFEYIILDSKTVFNQAIDNSIFKNNNITMINIWATYCASCVDELGDLQTIYEQYQNDGVGVLGIVSDLKTDCYKDKDLVKAINLINEKNIKYPNIYADKAFVQYATGKLFVIPTTIFVNSDGYVIGDIIESAYTKDQYIAVIEKLLANDSFIVEDTGLSCTIDGKCQRIKKKS